MIVPRSSSRFALATWFVLALAAPGASHGMQAGQIAADNASSALPATHAVRLATLEWLPYVGPRLPDNGLSGSVAATALHALGQSLHVDFFPWKRAMQVGSESGDYAGYFPAYYTEERARHCYFSAPMGRSTLGLATLREAPLRWGRLSDLSGVRIGVVAGYSNGREFDDLVREGRIQVDPSPGDSFNLKKLLAGHVRAAVIDKAVLRYLLVSDPDLAPQRDRIVFADPPLAVLTLHVCWQQTPTGQQLRKNFDAALRQLDLDKLENAYFLHLEALPASAPR